MKEVGVSISARITYDGHNLGHSLNSGAGYRFNMPSSMPSDTSLPVMGFNLERPIEFGHYGIGEIRLVAMETGPESVSPGAEFVLMAGAHIVARGQVLGVTVLG